MKKQPDKVDDFFREVLKEHTVIPSASAKEAFLKEAASLEESGHLNRKWIFFLSAVLVLISVSAGYFLLRTDPDAKITSVPVSSGIIKNSLPHTNLSSSLNKQQPSVAAVKENQKANPLPHPVQKTSPTNKKQSSGKNEPAAQASITRQNETPDRIADPSIPENGISINPSPDKTAAEPTTALPAEVSSQTIKESPSGKYSPPYVPPETTDTIPLQSQKEKATPSSGAPPRMWNICLGAYYAPEWMFNTLEGEKYVNNFGIEGTFHFGRYSIRTGAGLSITKGTNELSIGYNDYLGSYQKLDSMNFKWDNRHYKYVPTTYFSTQDVWDSLMKVADAKIVKQYTYLQIPLILGYDFWANEHFSFGFRAGPILSILLRTEQLSDNYDPGKNKIILVNQIAPERIQTNWQLLGGINATFHFSRRLGFELEPGVRYYFNSVYEKSTSNKKPWSVGIRGAFIVIL
ncbi:MAG: hypothetical protein NTW10_09485 [Bacteroidetes bacterium]|nr:hypothetical protein [Bacteroidota bacterium]